MTDRKGQFKFNFVPGFKYDPFGRLIPDEHLDCCVHCDGRHHPNPALGYICAPCWYGVDS